MTNSIKLTVVLGAALLLGACQSHMMKHGHGFSSADADAIVQYAAEWEDIYNNGDKADLANLVTDDVAVHQDEMPAVIGADAYVEFFSAPPVFDSLDIVVDEVKGNGNLAYGAGSYAGNITMPDGGAAHVIGKWLLVFVKGADGKWRASHHTASLDAPVGQ